MHTLPDRPVFNDAYSRDISVKVRSHLEVKRQKGQCIAPFAPYGYRKKKENRNQLEPDEEAAAVVRGIFKKKLEGYSPQAIARWLDSQNILSPMEYKLSQGSRYSSPFKKKPVAGWTAVAVLRILKNPVYVGTLVQGKRSSPNYKVKKMEDLPQGQWISVPGSHEPIISQETFDEAASMLRADTRAAPGQGKVYPLSGLVYCGSCGRSMVRKNNSSSQNPYIYYVCSGHKGKEGCTGSHGIRDKALEQAVLALIQMYLSLAIDGQALKRMGARLPHDTWDGGRRKGSVELRQKEKEKYLRYRQRLQADFEEGVVSREDFIAWGKRFEEKIREAGEAIELGGREEERLLWGQEGRQQWMEGLEKQQKDGRLTRRWAVALLERVQAYEGRRIQVCLRFSVGR